LERLRLSDSSFTHEEESSGVLGRGFRCGFLGMLHLEIVAERLRREFNLSLIVTSPSITYEVLNKKNKKLTVYSPNQFPADGEIQKIFEPWAKLKIITPADYLGEIIQLVHRHEAIINQTETFSGNRNSLELKMPLRELMRDFFDEIKSVTSGFASLSYKIIEPQETDVAKLEILVAEESVPAFARIVSRARLQEEAEAAVEKLYKILPRQLFTAKIQAKALGRIIASRTLKALRKDVTGYLYGGDVTRKRKLLERQKKYPQIYKGGYFCITSRAHNAKYLTFNPSPNLGAGGQGVKDLLVGGGVAANMKLREEIKKLSELFHII